MNRSETFTAIVLQFVPVFIDSMNASKSDAAAKSSRSVAERAPDTIDVLSVLSRQRWTIAFFSLLGLALGIAYALNSQVWYQSAAKILVSQTNAESSEKATSETVNTDVLANHMEVLRSRKIVEAAMEHGNLESLESITPFITDDDDAVDYVIERLELTKGGVGGAKDARSLRIAFSHTDPEEARQILDWIVLEYQDFIVNQLKNVMNGANELVIKAKNEVQTELKVAEADYLRARKEAPLLFQGEGSSNIYQDKYRRLEDELLDLQIQEASVRTRLDGVVKALDEIKESNSTADQLDKLALIDSESIERLALFAGLGLNDSRSAEFQATQPERMAEAQTQYNHMLELMSEKQRLSAVFGEGHPKVQDIDDEIALVKNFLAERQDKLATGGGLGLETIGPETLLRAYVGFLKHDLSAFDERKKELEILSKNAENKAKDLIDFELRDQVLRKNIERQEELFAGVVHQLRELDTAQALSGYTYELLETPRLGIKVWPLLSISSLGGLALGLLFGVSLAVANDFRDGRFRSAAELDDAIGLPTLGRIGKLNSISQGVKGLIATELSPDAEAFRMGRTLLLPDIRSGKLRTLGLSSPMQGDGKSTVASNFAVSVSQLGLKVLVIDADLRRPSQHRYFSVDITGGLTDIIAGTLSFENSLKSSDAENVTVITAGSSTNTPAETLQSTELDKVLALAVEQFDLVIIDLPPVLAVSDPLVVAPRINGLILVVRAATARRDEVANTMRRLRSAGGELVGCVLNTFGSGKKFNADGGYYGYYESSYTRPQKANRAAVSSRIAKPSRASGDAMVAESSNGRHIEDESV